MRSPNFLIIGTAKAGTTSLNTYLDEHPQIYMSPRKELNFFALEGRRQENFRGNFQGDGNTPKFITNLKTYRGFLEKVSNEVAIGEAFPLYLLSPKAPDRSKHYIPEVKLNHCPPLLPEIRQLLIEEEQEDILNLQELIQKALTTWLKV